MISVRGNIPPERVTATSFRMYALSITWAILTPTFLNRSPTILSADILADGVRGVVPNPLGIPKKK